MAPATSSRISVKRSWRWALLLVLAWLGFSFAWSWFVVNDAFESVTRQYLSDQAIRLAAIVAEQLQPNADPTAPLAAPSVVVQQCIRNELQHDPRFAYIMIWDHGVVLAHSRPELVGSTVSPDLWPPLAAGQSSRITQIDGLPWQNPARGEVEDVTVPVWRAGRPIASLSMGQPVTLLRQQFWRMRIGLLLAGLALIGTLLLLGALFWGQRAWRHTLLVQEQNVRARTSLLTERGMLASILAHEVRSPLTALRFNLHSLRQVLGKLEPQSAEAGDPARRGSELADLCEREIRRLDQMLNDFLTRTQVISPPEATSVNQVVHEALDFLRPALERRHIQAVTHLDAVNPRVNVNADELRQVLLNLAANAQDAMPPPPHQGVLVISTVADENSVTLLFRDNGSGIPPDLQQRIFDPFFSTKPQGSGLGLALVRRVVSGAGGSIFCESNTPETGGASIVEPSETPEAVEGFGSVADGCGTTFRIVLPLALETDPPANAAPFAVAPGSLPAPQPDDPVLAPPSAEHPS